VTDGFPASQTPLDATSTRTIDPAADVTAVIDLVRRSAAVFVGALASGLGQEEG
jgi:hypothetical protein